MRTILYFLPSIILIVLGTILYIVPIKSFILRNIAIILIFLGILLAVLPPDG